MAAVTIFSDFRPSEHDSVSPVSLSQQEASISLLSLSVRGQTEWKPQSQKTNQTDPMDHRSDQIISVAQLCPTLCDAMDCSLLCSCIHGVFQARILEWVAISFSRGSYWPRDQTQVSCTVGRLFIVWTTVLCLVTQLSLTFCDFMDCPSDSSFHGGSPGKNTGEGCYALIQAEPL